MGDFFENKLSIKFEEMIENNEEYYFDSDELEELIVHYLEIGDISYAELAVDFGLKLHPYSLEIKIKYLEVLIELENYTKAKELISELKNSSMEETDFLVCCAKYYSNLANPYKSIEYCYKALELGEEENFLHDFIADEYANLNDYLLALKHYQLALDADDTDDYAVECMMMCYSKLNKPQQAITFLKKYIDRNPFSEIAWFEYAQYYFNRKNYQEAINGYDYLLAINSDSIGVYANKAACYEAMKEWNKAVEVYKEMLDLEYTKAYTYYKIGLCYKESGQLDLALKAFDDSVKEDFQFYLSMVEQSFIYEEMGDLEKGIHYIKSAIEFNNNDLDYHKRLAYLYILNEQYNQLIEVLKTILDLEPDHYFNWYTCMEALMSLEEYQAALEIFEKATKFHQRAELHYQKSNALFALGRREEASKSLDHALKLDATLLEEMKEKYPKIAEEIQKIDSL